MRALRIVQKNVQICENFVKDVIYNRRHDAKARRLIALFKLLSIPFYTIVRLRQKAYQKRWLHNQHLGCMVIVVGNLTVGGTGKTPIVEKLAKSLRDKGRNVGVLSRGYKSKKESLLKKLWHWILHAEPCPPKVVSDGKSCLLPYEIAGDEPLLLAKNLKDICVVVDKDRVKAGQYAIQKFNCDTLVLDDGFQYFPLKGTFYILLVDATNPFGNGHVLPRGILREPLEHMQRAQFIFLTKCDQVSPQRLKTLERFIRHYNKQAPILPCVHQPKYLQQLNTNHQLPLTKLQGKKVAALSGIASPKSFEKFLINTGATIVYQENFLDHHGYTDFEIEEFVAHAKQAQAHFLITTEKDAMRIKNTNFQIPFYFLRMEIEWVKGTEPFECILHKLANEMV